MPPITVAAGIIAVDGPSGAGKSTLADELMRGLDGDAVLVRTDEFATWDDPVAWWPEFVAGVLTPFRAGADLRYRPRVWDGDVAEPGPTVVRAWRPILLVEGVSSARRAMAPHLSQAFWLDGPAAEQRLEAAVAREGEAAREHLRAWQRFEEGWYAVDRTRERCEVL
ncbi:uridine kinase family protein [Gordonia sp. (in: high G+C Gram-positive bacteria)]|uniref:uridine kinase family protein n=1 Tax=Gordonia sp. (in: high G+C Gram-positive bacteria) TaxID=84139 RepID=UPI0039E70CDF